MNIEQSKKRSMIDFLDKENVTLKKKKGNAYWYLSPFRDEKTASFKVSKKENLWYDYAIKEGGDLVELVKRMYNKQSVSDALAYLASKSSATVDKAIETAIPNICSVIKNDFPDGLLSLCFHCRYHPVFLMLFYQSFPCHLPGYFL